MRDYIQVIDEGFLT